MSGDSVQALLKGLKVFQEFEVNHLNWGLRRWLRKFLRGGFYRHLDRWLLTLGSTLGMLALELYFSEYSHDTYNILPRFHSLLLVGFGVDFTLHLIAKGTRYFYEISPHPIDQSKYRFAWMTDPWINVLSFATVGKGLDGYLDHSRVVRIIRMVRILRATRTTNIKESLEDVTVTQIDDERSRFVFCFVIGLSVMNLVPTFGPLIGMSFIMYAISRNVALTRGIINSIYTQRLHLADQTIADMLRQNIQLRFLAEAYTKSKDEVALLEDRFSRLLDMITDLVNPFGDDLVLGDQNEIVPKELEASVLFSDIRNFTPLTEKYGKKISPALADYFSSVLSTIKEHGGRLGNTTGDGLACYFKNDLDAQGRTTKSSERKAIECALAIRPIAEEFNQQMKERFPLEGSDNDHSTGIGMKSGELTLGDFLSRRKLEGDQRREIHKPDIIGATVNRAARIESLSKHYPDCVMLVTEYEYQRIDDEYKGRFQKFDSHELKGIGSVPIYGLVD